MSPLSLHIERVIDNALKKGISVSSSIFNNINQKIILNDIKFIIIDNRKYFYTEIEGIQYYCVFSNQQKRILEFFSPKSFSKNKEGHWVYKKVKLLTKVQIRRKKHAIDRAMDRYGLFINDSLYDELITLIKNQPNKLMEEKGKKDPSDIFEYHLMKINEKEYIVIFSPKTNSIVSFYHKKWLKYNEDGTWSLSQSNRSKKVKRKINNKKSSKSKDLKNKGYKRNKEKRIDLF